MHRVFSIAAHGATTQRAFGLDLKPLTVGHLRLISDCGLDFLDNGSQMGLGNILLATFICSQSHTSARKALTGRTWRLNRFLAKWGAGCQGFDLVAEASKFWAYLRESLSCPPQRYQGDGPNATTPYEWRLLAMLMSEFHMELSTALDTPVAVATALWAAQADRLRKAEFVPTDSGYVSLVNRALAHQQEKDAAKRAAATAATN